MKYIRCVNNLDIKVKVNNEDFENLNKYKWYFSKTGYTRATINKNRIFMHRYITSCPKNMEVDHINGDKLDNRRLNLRICTRKQNSQNSKKMKNCTSIYKGVRYDKSSKRIKRWMAAIETNGKCITIGRFHTQEEAATAYNKKALELFGEYANINNIDKD